MSYRIEAIPITLSHLQGYSPLQAFEMWFFIQPWSIWQDFHRHSASRSPSAIAVRLGLTKVSKLIEKYLTVTGSHVRFKSNISKTMENSDAITDN